MMDSEKIATQKKGMSHRSLEEWTRLVEKMHPKNIEMGLDRVRIVKERLGIHFDCPIIIVGGTNGKGSTCAMLQAIWKAAGYRVGLYTSPHIHRFNERMKMNGKMADDETLVRYFEMVDVACAGVVLTFFEFTTLVALKLFSEANLDVVVLEIGLGGRLDAVNLIDADVAVVTNVAIDHIEYLGNTREKIGFEKAGIYRNGRIAFYGDVDPPDSLLAHAQKIGADLKVFGRDYFCRMHDGQWDYMGKENLTGLAYPSLYGDNQVHNATTVLAVIETLQSQLPVNLDTIKRGLAHIELPGRFQILQDEPSVILDVAHNPHAAAVLAKNLRKMTSSGMTHAIFGAMADKDIDGIIVQMKDCVDYWYLTDLPLIRAAKADVLMEKLIAAGIRQEKTDPCIFVYHQAADALTSAKNKALKNDRIVAFGSFWVVTGVTKDSDVNFPINHH